jgi:hypothetical protein
MSLSLKTALTTALKLQRATKGAFMSQYLKRKGFWLDNLSA